MPNDTPWCSYGCAALVFVQTLLKARPMCLVGLPKWFKYFLRVTNSCCENVRSRPEVLRREASLSTMGLLKIFFTICHRSHVCRMSEATSTISVVLKMTSQWRKGHPKSCKHQEVFLSPSLIPFPRNDFRRLRSRLARGYH